MDKSIIKCALNYIDDMKRTIEQNQGFQSDVEQIEKDNFSKYTDFDYAQDIDDFMGDLNQPKFIGVGIEDKDKLQGYIYGYEFDLDDAEFDIDDEDDVSQFDFHGDKEKDFKEIKKAIARSKVLYVSNLVVNPDYRILLSKLIQKFVDKAKRAGFKFAVMETLSDSYRLFVGSDGVPNQSRLAKFGLKAVVSAKQYEGRDLLILSFI